MRARRYFPTVRIDDPDLQALERRSEACYARFVAIVETARRDGSRGLRQPVGADLKRIRHYACQGPACRLGLHREAAVHQAGVRQIRRREFRVVDQVGDDGPEGRIVDRHPFIPEQAQRKAGFEPRHRHVAAADPERGRDRHDPADVIHRQRRPEPVLSRHFIAPGQFYAVAHNGFVAQQAALRVGRGARGIEHDPGIPQTRPQAPPVNFGNGYPVAREAGKGARTDYARRVATQRHDRTERFNVPSAP